MKTNANPELSRFGRRVSVVGIGLLIAIVACALSSCESFKEGYGYVKSRAVFGLGFKADDGQVHFPFVMEWRKPPPLPEDNVVVEPLPELSAKQ